MSFHAKNGLYFQRRDDGSVWIEKRVPLVNRLTDDHTDSQHMCVLDHWELNRSEWQSVVEYVAWIGGMGIQ